jgi:hypothetical protein
VAQLQEEVQHQEVLQIQRSPQKKIASTT